MYSIQSQNHEVKLTAISPLKLTLQLFMSIFAEMIYSLRYNVPKTEN